MFKIFSSKLPISDDEFDWICSCCKWFADHFGGIDWLSRRPLVQSNVHFFPNSSATGIAWAEEIFDRVALHAGMADWPCDLVPYDGARPTHVGVGIALRHISEAEPAGTFSFEDGRYKISYDVALLDRPHELVATFAHELAHYLLHSAPDLPPGGQALEEHATDLGAVFLGFGAFMANSARSFEQFQTAEDQGWQSRQQGYLSELALTTAYALMTIVTASDRAQASTELKVYLQAPFKNEISAIERRTSDVKTMINSIDLAEWS